MKVRNKLTLTLGFFALFGISSLTGCGTVHSTDGRTTTILGFGMTTDGQTSTEFGVGKGMDANLSNARASTFSNRSPAASSVYGGN